MSDEEVNWDEYRKCSQVCRAETGEACFSLNGKIVNGQPWGVRTPLAKPHKARKRRSPKKKKPQ